MTTITLPFDAPPLTKNKVRRMHYQTEAKLRAKLVEATRWAIRVTKPEPMVGAIVVLHWRQPDKRRRTAGYAAVQWGEREACAWAVGAGGVG